MSYIVYLLNKHFLIPLLGFGILGGLILTLLGIYSSVTGNSPGSLFSIGIPLFVISIILLLIDIKLVHRKQDESVLDFILSAFFWFL